MSLLVYTHIPQLPPSFVLWSKARLDSSASYLDCSDVHEDCKVSEVVASTGCVCAVGRLHPAATLRPIPVLEIEQKHKPLSFKVAAMATAYSCRTQSRQLVLSEAVAVMATAMTIMI